MKKAIIPCEFLPWQDVLHDVPVPKEINLEEFSEIRARFIIGQDWEKPKDVNRNFKNRDNYN